MQKHSLYQAITAFLLIASAAPLYYAQAQALYTPSESATPQAKNAGSALSILAASLQPGTWAVLINQSTKYVLMR